MSDPFKDHKHDLRSAKNGGVLLVVRPGNKYGSAQAGDEVVVDARELRNPSTMAACAPREVLERAAAERAAAEEKLAAEVKKGSVQTAIDAGLAKIQQDALDAAKARAETEEEVAKGLKLERDLAEAANKLPDVFEQADSAILPGGTKRAAKPGGRGRGR